MVNISRHIPNLFTAGNLICGSLAIVFALRNDGFEFWPYLIFLAAFLDLFDGALARKLNVSGDLGKQLDSLADVISFGLAPSVIIFKLFENSLEQYPDWLKYIAFLNVLCAALRLARFNISTDQTTDFKGMPSPSNGIFWAAFALVFDVCSSYPQLAFCFGFPAIMLLSVLTSWLMISPIRMFSFKMKGGIKENKILLFFFMVIATLTILSLVVFSSVIPAVVSSILVYILFSLYYHFSLKRT